ncbi:MAG: multidrug efflux system membrane fusion protein [Gammaproteobacteria bacterium]
MNQKYVVSLIIGALVIVWLLSGQSNKTEIEQSSSGNEKVEKVTPIVRGIESVASFRQVRLNVRGRTEENRKVHVRAEVAGKVVSLPVLKGAFVNTDDELCRIAIDTKDQTLIEARANQHQAQLEYEGIRNLGKRGLLAETNVAKAKSVLESANAALGRAELQLAHTKIKSPFNGVVEEQPVELGDFMRIGDICAMVLDADPILLVGQIAEKDIGRVKLGEEVSGTLITGERLNGVIDFVSQSADNVTRSYRVEVKVANTNLSIRSGITAQLFVPLGTHQAHHISPALLVLDDSGLLGIKIVNAKTEVEFHTVEIIEEGPDGIWVTGLPNTATIIVVGQETVFAGEVVKLDVTPLNAPQKNG